MPTLYVENVPPDLYEALRDRAKTAGRSISSEVINLLAQNIPTAEELARRARVYEWAAQVRARNTGRVDPARLQSTEEMLREDRDR